MNLPDVDEIVATALSSLVQLGMDAAAVVAVVDHFHGDDDAAAALEVVEQRPLNARILRIDVHIHPE